MYMQVRGILDLANGGEVKWCQERFTKAQRIRHGKDGDRRSLAGGTKFGLLADHLSFLALTPEA